MENYWEYNREEALPKQETGSDRLKLGWDEKEQILPIQRRGDAGAHVQVEGATTQSN